MNALPDSAPPVRCRLRPPVPLLLWDGECGYCARWASRLQRLLGNRIACEPYQQQLAQVPEIAASQFEQAVFLILPDGTALYAAAAVFRALALRWPFGLLYWLYRRFPAFARYCERRYRKVAQSRHCRL